MPYLSPLQPESRQRLIAQHEKAGLRQMPHVGKMAIRCWMACLQQIQTKTMIPENFAQRVQARCHICPECDQKWLWVGNHADEPHRAVMEVGGKRYSVRKTLYRAVRGHPSRPVVTTTCHPACMNPEMMVAVTKASIIKRSIRDGKILNANHKLRIVGTLRARQTKLDLEKASEIRVSDLSSRVLAAEYGVSRQTIRRVKAMTLWVPVNGVFAGLMA